MSDTNEKEQTSTHKIGIYLWIWGLLFVLSFFSYMVDWYQFQGMLRWSLILFFMFLKAGLIMAFFMHLYWERYALVNVLLWPMTAIACFIFLMVAEFEYTVFTRFFYFVVGGMGAVMVAKLSPDWIQPPSDHVQGLSIACSFLSLRSEVVSYQNWFHALRCGAPIVRDY